MLARKELNMDFIKNALHSTNFRVIVLTEDCFEYLSPKMRRSWGGYIVSKAFEIWDMDSLEAGETDNRGICYEGLRSDTLEDAIDYDMTQWSSPNPKDGAWLTSEPKASYRSESTIQYSLFIKRADGLPLTKLEIDYISSKLNIKLKNT
jgi:hypothetical protein